MAIHRGEYIQNLIRESEYSITEVARRAQIGRNTLYRWIDNKNLPLVKMLKVSEALGADISFDFPKIEKLELERKKKLLNEQAGDENITIKTKYMLLLEKHNELLEELSILKEEIATYKNAHKT